jgi:RNA polymerase sigma-70 factor (ECF subfamily)
MSDEEIVKLIQDREREKFGEIIERYQGKLYGYLKNLTNQKQEEVEDLVEEVLVGAYINLQDFDTKRKFSSWIFRIAHNRAVDYFKKKKIKIIEIEDNEEIFGDKQKLLEDVEIEKENSKNINRAVESLELKYREVILLYYFEDKNYEEISDILHIPTNNVGVILYRGKEKLKKILNKNG